MASPPTPLPKARSLRILVAEDHPDGRTILCRLLERLGHRLEAAADGAEALVKALAFQPEVAILDIGMPHLDGFEVARKLRAAFGEKICLIAHTGYGSPEDYRRGREAGFDAYLVKPTDLGEMTRWLAAAASGLNNRFLPAHHGGTPG
jgi:CheY-like chemotaxis protein